MLTDFDRGTTLGVIHGSVQANDSARFIN
jgi:hypothetical protein